MIISRAFNVYSECVALGINVGALINMEHPFPHIQSIFILKDLGHVINVGKNTGIFLMQNKGDISRY